MRSLVPWMPSADTARTWSGSFFRAIRERFPAQGRAALRLYAQNPELTITQLCRRVGFNSMTTFNTAFGRNTGYTPAEWCKEYRKRNEAKAT